jgi:hypothetical protein
MASIIVVTGTDWDNSPEQIRDMVGTTSLTTSRFTTVTPGSLR